MIMHPISCWCCIVHCCRSILAIPLVHQHSMQPACALQENYGKPDGDSVQKIKAVYNDLGLEQRFFDYEQVGICSLVCDFCV
jgi:hypothetical protein